MTTDRRRHVREITLREIQQAARSLLVAEGAQGVTINAVARHLKMSGPAIYRYYASRDDLLAALTANLYHELIHAIATVRIRDEISLVPMCRALRQWALDNRAGFRMIFASPPLPLGAGQAEREDRKAAHAFARIFFDEVEAIWRAQGFAVPQLAELDPALRSQLEAYAQATAERLPPEALHVFLQCWIRLYGLLCMELLEHIAFAFTDAEPLYEACLQELCAWLHIPYPPRS